MPHGFDNIWGIVKDSGLVPSIFPCYFFLCLFVKYLMSSFSFSISVRLHITDEQKTFVHRVLEIPFEERKCRDLITLDTLHAYCGGLKLTPIACRLNSYSLQHKFFLYYLFLFVVSLSSMFNARPLSFIEMEATR